MRESEFSKDAFKVHIVKEKQTFPILTVVFLVLLYIE